MTNYIVYNEEGRILRVGVCPASMVQGQARQNETVMGGKANDMTQKIIGGRVVNKTANELRGERETKDAIRELQLKNKET